MIGTLLTWGLWAGIVALGLFLAAGLAFLLYSTVAVFLDGD
ncbi:hypothetical protein [Halorubrum gandharaense]